MVKKLPSDMVLFAAIKHTAAERQHILASIEALKLPVSLSLFAEKFVSRHHRTICMLHSLISVSFRSFLASDSNKQAKLQLKRITDNNIDEINEEIKQLSAVLSQLPVDYLSPNYHLINLNAIHCTQIATLDKWYESV